MMNSSYWVNGLTERMENDQISNMTETPDAILNQLPARLKAARKDKGLSLEAVAKLSGVSRSMLSQIERGESSPTIATLWNLTRALQVDFAGLLDGEADSQKIDILRAADTPIITTHGNLCSIHILSPPEDAGEHEVYEIRLEAGGELDSQPHARGAREHLTVFEGAVKVESGRESEVLKCGDTARYSADVSHSIKALEAARLYLIVMHP